MSIPTIFLKPGFAKPIWAGNPFIYPKAVEAWPDLALGDWLRVCDAKKQLIGYGVYNANSLYRVRMLCLAQELKYEPTLEDAVKTRLQKAIALRALLTFPSEDTNAYRCVNSEGDGLSGLTIDIFADHAVIVVTAAWICVHFAKVRSIIEAALPGKKILWRFMEKFLQQEGWSQALPECSESADAKKEINIRENGFNYSINPYEGQKTGFYCDQRETRKVVGQFAKNRRVLDAYCFSGGFSLHAAANGAEFVWGVDSSAPAIEQARQQIILNKLSSQVICFEEKNAQLALQEAVEKNIDFIILDPPKLAPSRKHLDKALKHYQSLNQAAIAALPEGGLLLTCSCSQAVSLEDFKHMLINASLQAGRNLQILKVGGAPADHPIQLGFPEGEYLKWILLRIFGSVHAMAST